MEVNALRGTVKDGAGVELYDYFDEFGLTQQSVDFVLGTAGTNVQAKCREVLRGIETELKGETMNGVLALVSPGFFDKLIGHAKVEEAYKYFSSTGAQPLREDTRRRFPFSGIVFEEYNATVTLSTGATETLIPANEGIAFPLGTMDTFVTYAAPARNQDPDQQLSRRPLRYSLPAIVPLSNHAGADVGRADPAQHFARTRS